MPTEAQPEAEVPQERNMAQVAADHFGPNKFFGTVPEAQQVEETPDADEREVVQEAEEQEVQFDDEEAGVQEEEQQVVESLQELIEAQEWDPEWVQSLRVPVKVDGEQAEATLDDLVRSYQTQTAAEKRLEEAKAKAQAIKTEAQQQQESGKAQMAVLGQLMQAVEQNLQAQYDPQEMERLRKDDPAEWSARNAELGQKRQQLDQMKRQALGQYQQALQAQQQQEQQQRMQALQAEQEALLASLPAWREPETAKAEQTQLVGYLTDQGFSHDDVMGASDHRLIVMARKAMLYDQGQQATDVTSKKLKKVPKVLKPGAPKTNEERTRAKESDLQRKVRSARRPDAALGAAVEMMKLRRK